VIPLLVYETTTAAVRAEYDEDPSLMVWWGTEVECVSALARLERDGSFTRAAMKQALERLAALRGSWHELQPAETIRREAIRILRVHDLLAANALQLSAALAAAEGVPASLDFFSLDGRLSRAADREGLRLVELPRAV